MVRRRILCFLCLLSVAASRARADDVLARFGVVEVAPVETSIYVGQVALTASPFHRTGGIFAATYVAKVTPFFFYNEKGTLQIVLPEAALRHLAAGAPVSFVGTATRSDGLVRLVEGRAAATAADQGTLKVRLHLNRRVVLVFNTTYRLPGVLNPSAAK